MAQADMVTMREISVSGRDAPRKFWRYLGTLNGREQCLTILDEDTGQPTERLGQCLTDHLIEVFSPPEATPLQDLSPTEDKALTPDDATFVTIERVSLIRALAHIKDNTAQGLDKIPARFHPRHLREHSVWDRRDSSRLEGWSGCTDS